MREFRSRGSVRGAAGNGRPYREHFERPLGMSALPPIATKNGEPVKRRRREVEEESCCARTTGARRKPRAVSGVAGGASAAAEATKAREVEEESCCA